MDFQTKNKLTLLVMLFAVFAFAESVLIPPKPQRPSNNFCVGDGANSSPEVEAHCKKLVGGAATWEEAATWAVNRLLRLTNRSVTPVLTSIEAKLLPSIAPEKKASLVKTCKDSYADVVKAATTCKKLIISDPNMSFMSQLSYVTHCYKDCKENIMLEKGQPEILELNKLNKGIDIIVEVLINLANKDPRTMKL